MLQGKAPIIYGDGEQKRCLSYIDDSLDCMIPMLDQENLNRQIIFDTKDIGKNKVDVAKKKIQPINKKLKINWLLFVNKSSNVNFVNIKRFLNFFVANESNY